MEAIFAGGCFWCMESDFDRVKGVVSTEVGYTGGDEKNPTYKQVSSGTTGHVEAIKIEFDPKVISYRELLGIFWKNVDPTRDDGQFCDTGKQYRPVIFYLDAEQKSEAEASKKAVPIQPNKVEILPAKSFYPAEEYHQEYYKKNPVKYKFYRYTCGRDARLKELNRER